MLSCPPIFTRKLTQSSFLRDLLVLGRRGGKAPNQDPSGLGVFEFNGRFAGQWFDAETGLYHNGFRDYHPGLGRYVQSDPIGLAAGWNTYAYVENSPLAQTDPSGLSAEDVIEIALAFNESVSDMTRKRIRNENPRINNIFGKEEYGPKYPWLPPEPFGHPKERYEVCSGQVLQVLADFSMKNLNGRLRDTWILKSVYNGSSHHWIEATSSKKGDPKIWLDPWDNQFSVGKPCRKCK